MWTTLVNATAGASGALFYNIGSTECEDVDHCLGVAESTNQCVCYHRGDTCLDSGWPQFESAAALAADPWGEYLRLVYGEVPQDPSLYPWCTGDMWLYYSNELNASRVTDIPALAEECPTAKNQTVSGQRYGINNGLSPKGISWSWHPSQPDNPRAAQPAFANDTWVEVMHRKFPTDEKTGMWFYYAKGSAIWFNLGTTIAFEGHGPAYNHFNVTEAAPTFGHARCASDPAVTTPNECMCAVAADAGFDSIQMLASAPQSCSYSSSAAVKANMNYELVSTKLQGMYPCGSADGRSPLIKSGWMGDRPCTCNNTAAPTLNLYCEESPATRVFVQGGE